MHWSLAVKLARTASDVTYKEWCDLWVDHLDPTPEQRDKASKMAHVILLRNRVIADQPIEVIFGGLDDMVVVWHD